MSKPVAYLNKLKADQSISNFDLASYSDENWFSTPLYEHPDPHVAELEYRLHKQAEVHAYEKEALQHQIKMLSDPIVRQKMLEPTPPIYIEADKFVDQRVAELEALLLECRRVFDYYDCNMEQWSVAEERKLRKEVIAKIDEVLAK